MNKTKILTSLSALAAVFVFNGNAMAGTYNPICAANVYKITVADSNEGYYKPGDTVCRGGDSTCTEQQCPAKGTEYTVTYGSLDNVLDPIFIPTRDCNTNPIVTIESWSLYDKKGDAVVSGLEPGSYLTYKAFEGSDGTVLPGGDYTLAPVYSGVNTYRLEFDCTDSDDLTDGSKTQAVVSNYRAGTDIGLADICQVPGYEVTFMASGTGHTGTPTTILEISDDSVEGFKDGSTVKITATYTPKCVPMYFYQLSTNGPVSSEEHKVDVAYFKNPDDKNSKGTFYSDSACKTLKTKVTVPDMPDYTVRGYVSMLGIDMCTTGNPRLVTGQDADALNTEDWNAVTSGVLGAAVGQVLTDSVTYCTSLAKDCSVNPGSHAFCQLDVSTDGKVTYTNCCEAGYNGEGLGSTKIGDTTCGD